MKGSVFIFVSCLLFPRIFLGAEVLNSQQEVSPRSAVCLSEPKVIDRLALEVAYKSLNRVELTGSAIVLEQGQDYTKKQGWMKRHPVAFGALLGFGAGFAIGLAAGDDGFPLDDMESWGNGIILGGVFSGVGALIGLAISGSD